jgi:hypothetical protein
MNSSLNRLAQDRSVWRLAAAIFLSRIILIAFANRLNIHDADRYLQEAANLLQYGTLSGNTGPNPQPLAHDLPGYPLLLSLLMLAFNHMWLVLRVAAVVNACAFTGVALLVYRLLTVLGNTRLHAASAMLLFALFPESLPFSVFVMPECIFMLCFLGSVFVAVNYLLEPRKGALQLAFALLGCSAMLKPVSLGFAAVLVVTVLIRFWPKPQMRRTVMLAVASGLLLEAAICSPWVLRNYRLFGSASFTTLTGSNLFWFNYRYMLLDKGLPDAQVEAMLNEEMKRVAAETPDWDTNIFVQSRVLTKMVIAKIAADPIAYAKTVIKRYPNLYGGTGALDLIDMIVARPRPPIARLEQVYSDHAALQPLRIALSVLLCTMYVLIIAGTIVLIRKHSWQVLLLAWIPIMYFSALYGPVTSSRYRFVLTPFFALLASYGLPQKLLALRRR